MNDFDPRPRQLEKPEEGFWIVRCVKGGPLVPACIVMLSTWFEPEVPENRDMERPSHLGAYISGQPVATREVWLRRGRVITREQYDALIAEIRENISANRYDPRTTPFRTVDLSRVAIPFSEPANV